MNEGVDEKRHDGGHQEANDCAAEGRAHDGAEDERGDGQWHAQHQSDEAKETAGSPSPRSSTSAGW